MHLSSWYFERAMQIRFSYQARAFVDKLPLISRLTDTYITQQNTYIFRQFYIYTKCPDCGLCSNYYLPTTKTYLSTSKHVAFCLNNDNCEVQGMVMFAARLWWGMRSDEPSPRCTKSRCSNINKLECSSYLLDLIVSGSLTLVIGIGSAFDDIVFWYLKWLQCFNLEPRTVWCSVLSYVTTIYNFDSRNCCLQCLEVFWNDLMVVNLESDAPLGFLKNW